MAKNKERLDMMLFQRGLAISRNQAQALIMAGEVFVDGQRVDKAGSKFEQDVTILVKQRPAYVSRGGEKLAGALAAFGYNPNNLVCADVGASTGGFTDCLLQNGALRIYAIDVGYGQLAHSLRIDGRVIVMERTNARHIQQLNEPIDLVVIDASFISLKLLLPNIKQWLSDNGDVIALIKPQFEAGKSDVGKGGVVRDHLVHVRVLRDILQSTKELGFRIHRLVQSPLKGPAGNIEFLVWLTLEMQLPSLDVETWLHNWRHNHDKNHD